MPIRYTDVEAINTAANDGKCRLVSNDLAECPSCRSRDYVTSIDGLRYCQACAYEDPTSAALPAAPPDERPDPDEVQARDARAAQRLTPKPTTAGQPRSNDAGPAAAIGNDALAAAQALHERIVRTEGKLVEARAELSRLVEMARTAGLPIPGDLEQAAPRRASAWKRHEQVVSCPDCGRICGSPAGLSIHRRAKHNHIKDAT